MIKSQIQERDEAGLLITNLKNGQTLALRQSQHCIKGIIDQIVNECWSKIQLNNFYVKYLPTYSNNKLMGNIDEVNSLVFNIFPWMNKNYRQEQEPIPLNMDSLLPISAEIDEENVYKKNNSKKSLPIDEALSRSKISKREEIVEKKQKYSKLQMTEISQQDGLTKELRKIQDDNNHKVQNQRKIKQKKEKILEEKLKDKKKNSKQDRFSFDYNGEVFEIRLESKANLVSKVINGLTNQNTKLVKPLVNDPNPVQVQSNSKKDKKLVLFSKRKDEVQFSDVKSLADNIQTKVGVKYTYEGKTFQEKPKILNPVQIRKTLSQRKISKQDYKKIRDLNGNTNDYQENLKKIKPKEQDRNKRTYSEAKYIESRQTFRKKERIHVNSNELKGKLLQKLPQNIQETPIQGREQASAASRLGNIDNFNLQYLRTGGSLHASTSRQFYTQRSNNQLPRITHTTLYSKMIPKGRERIKDANQIIRDLRKKFQEKLRV